MAGYDLTFSPVKSVSVLWAIADPKTAAVIERAHQAAIKDALDFIETKALFTRRGTNGVRQVDVRGLVATAFTHRDSRAGDPDLHTHVAVANKVQTLDGKWLAIDGRLLYKAVVSASETYNTALERHLVDALGVRFAERPNERRPQAAGARDRRRRPRPEPPVLQAPASVEDRRKVLAAAFQATHGRPRRRSRPSSWPSRPPWRPARPSTSRARWPSSARPGTARPSRCSAPRSGSSRWSTAR